MQLWISLQDYFIVIQIKSQNNWDKEQDTPDTWGVPWNTTSRHEGLKQHSTKHQDPSAFY